MHALTNFARSLFRPVRFPSLATAASGCLSFVCLTLLTQPALAQSTTYNIVPGIRVSAGRGSLRGFNLQLQNADGSSAGSIPDIQGVIFTGVESCAGVQGDGTGYYYLTLGSTNFGCINAESYSENGIITVNGCTGAAQGIEVLSGPGVQTIVTLNYTYIKERFCFAEIANKSTMVVKQSLTSKLYAPLVYRCGANRQDCFHEVVFSHHGRKEF